MPTVNATKFNKFADALAKGGVNLNSDTLKYMLVISVAPVVTNNTYADIVANEVANGNGYVAGGISVPSTSATNSGGVETVTGGTVTWTASGAGFTFRYVVLYDTANGQLIEFWDNGSPVVLSGTLGDTFGFTPSSSTLLTIQ